MPARVGVLIQSACLILSGCGGGRAARRTGSHQCQAVIGFEAALNEQLGRQQLAFAELALSNDNSSHRTRLRLLSTDTRGKPSRAAAMTDDLVARTGVVAVVGPASGREVARVGSTFARAGVAFISPSATEAELTNGANPTFFRVAAPSDLQGPQEAHFIVAHLHPRAVMLISGQTRYSRQLASSMVPIFRAARLPLVLQPARARTATISSVGARITSATSVIVTPWQSASAAERFGRALLQQRKSAALVGPDRLFAPGRFTIPGSYVSMYAPDITALPHDAGVVQRIRRSTPNFGLIAPLAYVAEHVVDDAITRVCRSGRTPSRSDVLAAVRNTNESTSILGVPIRFQPDGNLAAARWFMFRIDSRGDYRMISQR